MSSLYLKSVHRMLNTFVVSFPSILSIYHLSLSVWVILNLLLCTVYGQLTLVFLPAYTFSHIPSLFAISVMAPNAFKQCSSHDFLNRYFTHTHTHNDILCMWMKIGGLSGFPVDFKLNVSNIWVDCMIFLFDNQ